MPGILPSALLLAMGLGALIISAVIFKYIVHNEQLRLLDLGFCTIALILIFPGTIKSVDFVHMVINFDWAFKTNEPTKAEISRDKIEEMLRQIDERLASCNACRVTAPETAPPEKKIPLPDERATGPRVVVIWEATKQADGADIVKAIRAIAAPQYRVEGVTGDLGVVRAALPADRAIDIRVVSKVENIADRNKILDAIKGRFAGRIEASTWPLANGDVQIQIFQR